MHPMLEDLWVYATSRERAALVGRIFNKSAKLRKDDFRGWPTNDGIEEQAGRSETSPGLR